MKPHLRYILLAMLLATALLSISRPASTQQEDESKQILDFTNLTLEIASTKQRFIHLEPVPIVLTLSNKTSQKVLGHDAIGFNVYPLELFVTRDGGERRRIEQLSSYSKGTEVSTKKIAPGKQTQAKELLTIDLAKIFPEPGTYQLEAVLHDADWKLQITSAPLTLQISAPEGNDVAAYGYLIQQKNLSRFFSGAGLIEFAEEREALEEFVMAYGDSTYGDYASFLSGRIHFARKDYQRAILRLSKVAAKPNFYLADEVKEYLDKVKQRLKDPANAQ